MMSSDDTKKTIAILNSSWPGKPLDKMAAAMWGAELSRYPLPDVLRVLRTLMRTEKWRPGLAQILKPLAPASRIPSAYAAFETVWDQIPKQPRVGGELELRAVNRLGGWHVLGNWELTKREWHFKAFKEAYEDLVDSKKATDLRSIAGGRQQALGEAK